MPSKTDNPRIKLRGKNMWENVIDNYPNSRINKSRINVLRNIRNCVPIGGSIFQTIYISLFSVRQHNDIKEFVRINMFENIENKS
jgi:hypothetical protein